MSALRPRVEWRDLVKDEDLARIVFANRVRLAWAHVGGVPTPEQIEILWSAETELRQRHAREDAAAVLDFVFARLNEGG